MLFRALLEGESVMSPFGHALNRSHLINALTAEMVTVTCVDIKMCRFS